MALPKEYLMITTMIEPPVMTNNSNQRAFVYSSHEINFSLLLIARCCYHIRNKKGTRGQSGYKVTSALSGLEEFPITN